MPSDQDPAGPETESAAPTCYRHPGRETHIRCTRCDRPICPDCMVSAAVGFQCPGCVRDGARTTRQGRTTFGGRITEHQGQVTKILIGLNVLVFILARIRGDALVGQLALVGQASLPEPAGVAEGEWYRLMTAAFLHVSLFHILFNMWALWIFGPTLEAMLGRFRFVGLYLLSALGGSAASYAFSSPFQFSLGASGAIFGLFGALIVIGRRLRYDIRALLVLLGVNIAIGFAVANIDWRAHLGGLVTGSVLAVAFAYAPRERRALVQGAGALVVAVAVAALLLWRTAQFTG
ncbi:MAG: rhomboid family intramembrane serine protease [Streptomycetales bacterium]